MIPAGSSQLQTTALKHSESLDQLVICKVDTMKHR